jgi:2-oxoglutarate dehydrogenase E1 component
MTPKSLLRHGRAASTLQDFSQGTFQRIIGDTRSKPQSTGRIILCCGKIYYDIEQRRQQAKQEHVAILRVEQLYPLSDRELQRHLESYASDTPVLWVQEEPENMGAWPYLRLRFGETLFGTHPLSAICREPAASPATGSARLHKEQQLRIISAALDVRSSKSEEHSEEISVC